MKFATLVAAAFVALGAAGAATATTVNFDLRSFGDVTSNTGNSVVAESGGISATITGFAFSGGITGTGWQGDATAWGNGIGLTSRQPRGRDQHFVDGYYDEYLVVSFSEAVDLTGLQLSYVNRPDDWTVLSGTLSDYMFEDSGGFSSPYWGPGWSTASVSVDSDTIGTSFLIGTTGNRSEWKLRGLSVHVPDVAPVPLPASSLLLLAGVGGLVAAKRRRKSS